MVEIGSTKAGGVHPRRPLVLAAPGAALSWCPDSQELLIKTWLKPETGYVAEHATLPWALQSLCTGTQSAWFELRQAGCRLPMQGPFAKVHKSQARFLRPGWSVELCGCQAVLPMSIPNSLSGAHAPRVLAAGGSPPHPSQQLSSGRGSGLAWSLVVGTATNASGNVCGCPQGAPEMVGLCWPAEDGTQWPRMFCELVCAPENPDASGVPPAAPCTDLHDDPRPCPLPSGSPSPPAPQTSRLKARDMSQHSLVREVLSLQGAQRD